MGLVDDMAWGSKFVGDANVEGWWTGADEKFERDANRIPLQRWPVVSRKWNSVWSRIRAPANGNQVLVLSAMTVGSLPRGAIDARFKYQKQPEVTAKR